jgi:hypothetical protein
MYSVWPGHAAGPGQVGDKTELGSHVLKHGTCLFKRARNLTVKELSTWARGLVQSPLEQRGLRGNVFFGY